MAVKVVIVEVDEAGPAITETKSFPTKKAAQKFVKKFNEKHGIDDLPKKPDWYMYAKVIG